MTIDIPYETIKKLGKFFRCGTFTVFVSSPHSISDFSAGIFVKISNNSWHLCQLCCFALHFLSTITFFMSTSNHFHRSWNTRDTCACNRQCAVKVSELQWFPSVRIEGQCERFNQTSYQMVRFQTGDQWEASLRNSIPSSKGKQCKCMSSACFLQPRNMMIYLTWVGAISCW